MMWQLVTSLGVKDALAIGGVLLAGSGAVWAHLWDVDKRFDAVTAEQHAIKEDVEDVKCMLVAEHVDGEPLACIAEE